MQPSVLETPPYVEAGSSPAARRLPLVDLFAICLLGLLPIALLPGFFYPTNLRQAIALAVLPLGSWLLGTSAVRGADRAARWAVVFLAFAAATALFGDHPALSVFGSVNFEMSVLALAMAFSWWAVGRRLTRDAVRLLAIVLTVGAGVNVLVGVVQFIVDPRDGIYGSFGGRLSGLMSNPVYFASTFVGVWAYWFIRTRRRVAVLEQALVLGLAICLGLSGSRVAAGVVVLVAVIAALRDQGRRSTIANGLISISGVVVGTVALNIVSSEQGVRYSTTDGGLRLRLAVWRNAIETWSDRPVFGYGVDPYLRVPNQRFGRDGVREFGAMQWPDPHNVLILVLVSFGLFGLLALIMFVVLGLRGQIDFALLAAAAAMAMTWLLQPVVVTTWPLAFALFGAAVRPQVPGADGERQLIVERLLVVCGLVMSALLIAWNLQFTAALASDRSGAIADTRASVMRYDPTVAAGVAEAYLEQLWAGAATDNDLARAEDLAARAVNRSESPSHWALLVELQLAQSEPQRAFDTALDWVETWPNDPRGYRYVGAVGNLVGRFSERDAAAAALCEIRGECDRLEPATESGG